MIPLFFTLSYFNSHAHVERDNNVVVATLQQTISTHTLTWSVTEFFLTGLFLFVISTHTLTWSVTICIKIIYNSIFYFNSHAHVERD